MADLDLSELLATGLKLAGRVADEAYYVSLCVRSGIVRPEPPRVALGLLLAFERFGLLAGPVAAGALRHGQRIAVADERGEITYRQLHERSNALANAWRERGLRPGEGVAILARNHRGFLEAVFAAAKCGAKIILLNTSFAGPQARDVADREGTEMLVYDDEYAGSLGEGPPPRHGRFRAWVDEERAGAGGDETLDALIAGAPRSNPPRAGRAPRIVILTSGTTGAPKGAPRNEPRSLAVVGSLLDRVPFRARETTELCVPLFHTFGLANMALSLALGSTIVLRRHFDPERALASLEESRASAMIIVPVMLQRMLDLGEEAIARRDLRALRIIFMSGSQLGPRLARRGLDAFGPVLYNLYGSTEIAYATVATPEDLYREPGCAGKPVHGTVVKILDEGGAELAPGRTGRIFVANSAQFEGYTGGEHKEQVRGLMSSGDVGHFDEQGRLFIDGRDDEMIVSGGENVFPGEVEELLAGHAAVSEVAVVGIEDERFGQRLKAFVVLRDGHELTADEIKDHVRDNLARYKIPREVEFLDELPRTATGKVLKRVLRGERPASQEPAAAANE